MQQKKSYLERLLDYASIEKKTKEKKQKEKEKQKQKQIHKLVA